MGLRKQDFPSTLPIRRTSLLGLKEVMLTPQCTGAKAEGVENLNALLVGEMRVDLCLTEDKKHGLLNLSNTRPNGKKGCKP